MAEEEIPQWFVKRIRRGLAALIALRMEGHPSVDVIDATAKVWVQALWPGRVWDEDLDQARIGECFRLLALNETRWPTPAIFLRYLPDRPQQRALPSPPPSAEERERARAYLAEMRRRLGGGEPRAAQEQAS